VLLKEPPGGKTGKKKFMENVPQLRKIPAKGKRPKNALKNKKITRGPQGMKKWRQRVCHARIKGKIQARENTFTGGQAGEGVRRRLDQGNSKKTPKSGENHSLKRSS